MVSCPCHLWKLLPGDMTPVDALRGVQSLLQTEPGKNSERCPFWCGTSGTTQTSNGSTYFFRFKTPVKWDPMIFGYWAIEWMVYFDLNNLLAAFSFAPGCPTLPTSHGTGTNWQPHDGYSDTVERFAWNWKNKTPCCLCHAISAGICPAKTHQCPCRAPITHKVWSKMHVHVEVLLQLFIGKVNTELLEGIPWTSGPSRAESI